MTTEQLNSLRKIANSISLGNDYRGLPCRLSARYPQIVRDVVRFAVETHDGVEVATVQVKDGAARLIVHN